MSNTAWLGCLLLAVAVASSSGAAARALEAGTGWTTGEPLRVRNASPVTQLFGLPRMLGPLAQADHLELTLLLEHGNSFTGRVAGSSALVMDGSTTVASLALRGGAGARWEWGLEVPYVHHGGGFTDGFIEEFHDLFGFPDGARHAAPRNRLDYRVIDEGGTVVEITGSEGHLGDVRAWVGYRVHRTPGREAVLRMMIEAPTGEVEDLSGSESTDAALWLELVDVRALERLNTTITLAAGVTAPGGGGVLAEERHDLVPHAHLGLHYPLGRRVTLRGQIEGHADVADSRVPHLAEGGLLGTLGSSIRLSPEWRLDLALVEDLTPHRAPDVVFVIMLGARW